MGTGSSKPASGIALDLSKYTLPPEVRTLLVGRNEVKRYLAGDPVNKWISRLPDEGPDVHPFLVDLGFGLCHSSEVASTTLISGAIKSDISERDHAATFFAFDDRGYLVGISVVSLDPNHPDEVYREITCAGIRRAGWGRRLDQAVVAYAKELGKTRIRLTPAGSSARAAHEAVGFRYIEVDDDGEESMVKDISGGRRTRRRAKRTFRRKNKQWTRRR